MQIYRSGQVPKQKQRSLHKPSLPPGGRGTTEVVEGARATSSIPQVITLLSSLTSVSTFSRNIGLRILNIVCSRIKNGYLEVWASKYPCFLFLCIRFAFEFKNTIDAAAENLAEIIYRCCGYRFIVS